MKKLILATVCVAALSALGTVGASAQMTGPEGQQTMGMNFNARMMHRHHMMMKRPMHRRP